jgi:hypothetical protein
MRNGDSEIATESAEINVAHTRNFPLADAIIGATTKHRNLVCFTHDEQTKSLSEIMTRWFQGSVRKQMCAILFGRIEELVGRVCK